jgi:hypothetical protein
MPTKENIHDVNEHAAAVKKLKKYRGERLG